MSEKARLERMYQVMELARKEELEKGANEPKDIQFKKINEDNFGEEKLSAKIQNRDPISIKVAPASKVVNNVDVEDDVFPTKAGFPFDDSDMLEVDDAEEQLKILEAIKRRNEEKKKEEELTLKLINKLSLDEPEELTSQNLNDDWPALGETAPSAGETAKEKIERLKRMAERRGMSVNSGSSIKNMEHTYSMGR